MFGCIDIYSNDQTFLTLFFLCLFTVHVVGYMFPMQRQVMVELAQ